MSVRFLHTSDWQLGMTRSFLTTESQSRYTDDQFAMIRTMAQIADDNECQFVVVAGDVFEHMQPDRKILGRAADALRTFSIPVYLLPGNHDADSPAALWSNSDILDRLPNNVMVIRDSNPALVPGIEAEVVGAPLPSRKPDRDLLSEVLEGLHPLSAGRVRVVVGHGQVEGVSFNGPDEPVLVSRQSLESAITDRRASYIALGDRHSLTNIGDTGAIWYSGAPLATAYREDDPNHALIVEIEDATVSVTDVSVGAWRFLTHEIELSDASTLTELENLIATLPDKERTVLRLGLTGTISLSTSCLVEEVLERGRELLAGLEISTRRSELLVIADDADLADLRLSGFAQGALLDLAQLSGQGGSDSETASEALMLLHRLALRTR